MKRAEKRQHLVSVARELFNEHGYHAVGVDQITAEAGVAKTTLYRHFKSKEDLIVEVLRTVDEQTREDMRRTVDRTTKQIGLLSTFDFLKEWFESDDYFGCPFIGAAKEYCDPGSPVNREAALHKRLVLAYFEELAHKEGFASPKQVAEEINLLHEGATAVAQITRNAAVATEAKSTAARLLAGLDRVSE